MKDLKPTEWVLDPVVHHTHAELVELNAQVYKRNNGTCRLIK